MPASLLLRTISLSLIFIVVVSAAFIMPTSPPKDPYRDAMRLVAGIFLIAGSFTLSRAIEDTFLRAGGNRAFQAFYCATLAVPGTGLAVAASAVYPVNVSLAVGLTALLFSGAGVALLRLERGGA